MKIKSEKYLYLSIFIMILLFISSSMTYKEQSSVPFLQKYLTSQPFKDILSQVSFSYGHSVISIKEVGYYKFVEFLSANWHTFPLILLWG